MLIYKTSSENSLYRYKKAIVLLFNGKRSVLSTGSLNGGYSENLTAVFNKDENPGAGMPCKLRANTYKEHMELIANELGLDSNTTTGLSTAASMENVAIVTKSHDKTSVTSIVTGGVEINGLRAGDPASYDETKLKKDNIDGTINIILDINARLPKEAMAKALIVSTEAKSAALFELMAKSNYSCDIATGSGTDGIIIISNIESDLVLTNAGGHSKLGELIGVAVKEAVKEALNLQTGLNPVNQHSLIRRFERYGINEDSLYETYLNIFLTPTELEISLTPKELENTEKKFLSSQLLKKVEFGHLIHCIDTENNIVTASSLYIHLLDQFRWGLLSKEECGNACILILKNLKNYYDINENMLEFILKKDSSNLDELMGYLLSIFKKFIVLCVISSTQLKNN